jgi:hypothetical protein
MVQMFLIHRSWRLYVAIPRKWAWAEGFRLGRGGKLFYVVPLVLFSLASVSHAGLYSGILLT